MWNRIAALVAKELRQLLSTRRNVMLLLTPLVLQLALFPFATTLEVRNATLAIFNEDQGAQAVELVQRLAAASAFGTVMAVHDDNALRRAIDAQDALLAIRIPADFSAKVETR